MIREDALDEERPCRDPNDWHRTDIDDNGDEYPFPHIHKGEITRFPYAVLEIKTAQRTFGSENKSSEPHWVTDLMKSHLVKEAPRFSKYAHGVSVLFENYVNLLPFWLSEMDDDIRKDPKQVYEDQQKEHQAGKNGKKKVVWEPRASISQGGSPSSKGKGPELETLPPVPRITITESSGEETQDAAAQPLRSVRSLLGLVKPSSHTSGSQRRHHSPVKLPPGVRKPASYLKNAGPVKVETKVWLANERTFIKWMHVSTLMAALSLALYNGAADIGNGLAMNFGAVYVFLSVAAAIWAYFIYLHRSHEIRNRSPKHMDDRIGPIIIGVALIFALIANFVFKVNLNCALLISSIPSG